MTLLKIDGFEHRDPTRYPIGVASFQTTTRFGVGYSMNGSGVMFPFAASSRAYVGFAANFGTSTNAFLDIRSNSGNSTQLSLERTANGACRLVRTGATLALSSDNVFPANTWVFLEFTVVLDNTAGEFAARVNGSQIMSFTGDTFASSSGSLLVDAIGITMGGGSFVDDLYICDGLGSTNNNFLGDVRVRTLVPTGNGANSGLTGSDGNSVDNYLLVDELPPSETDYVGSGVAGAKDTYALTDLATTAPVKGIQHGISVYKSDAGSINARSVIRSGGTDYPGSTVAPGTTKSSFLRVLETNPATGAAWTTAEVNAAEAGVEIVA